MWVELLIAGYLRPLAEVGDIIWVEDSEEAERVLEAGVAKRASKTKVQRHLEAQGGGGPLPEEAPVEEESDRQDLERLTKAELADLAAEQDLELDPNHMTKADMIAAIEEAWEQRE